jgi:hypothetical protein
MKANSMDPDHTARMRRLVWIHAGHKPIMMVLSWRGSNKKLNKQNKRNKKLSNRELINLNAFPYTSMSINQVTTGAGQILTLRCTCFIS